MGRIVFAVIVVNMALFALLATWAWRYSNSEVYPRLQLMARTLSVIAVAFLLGATTRLVAVGIELGWFPASWSNFLFSGWHLIQSLAALALGAAGVMVVRRLAVPIRSAERIANAVSKQLMSGVDLSDLGLTARELQVVEAIAAGHVSDAEIGELLFISPATAGTHVKNILKKTGLRNRRELALLFASTQM